jgi:hypothetical protein
MLTCWMEGTRVIQRHARNIYGANVVVLVMQWRWDNEMTANWRTP